jgi:hypothetical protein
MRFIFQSSIGKILRNPWQPMFKNNSLILTSYEIVKLCNLDGSARTIAVSH